MLHQFTIGGISLAQQLSTSLMAFVLKIVDIGSDLMKIVFKIKEDDARNHGVIADCTGDNAGDSVGPLPTAFENLRRERRRSHRLHSSSGVKNPSIRSPLLVWIVVAAHRTMLVASAVSYCSTPLSPKAASVTPTP